MSRYLGSVDYSNNGTSKNNVSENVAFKMEYLKMKAKQIILSILFIPTLAVQSFAMESTDTYHTQGSEKISKAKLIDTQSSSSDNQIIDREVIDRQMYEDMDCPPKLINKYDDAGRLIARKEFHKRFTYQYDEHGNLILEKEYTTHMGTKLRLYKKTERTYNSQQKLTHKKETFHFVYETETVYETKIDENGNEVEIICYEDGKLKSKEEKTFFKNGKIQKEHKIDYLTNFDSEKTYNELGQIVSSINQNSKKEIFKEYNKYDKDKIIEREKYTIVDGVTQRHWFGKYDNQERVIEEIAKSEYTKGKPHYSHKILAYNQQSLVSEEKNFDRQGNFRGRVVFKYNGKGNKTEVQYYDSNNQRTKIEKIRYSPFHNGIKSEKIYDGKGKLKTKILYKYRINLLTPDGFSYDDKVIINYD